MKTITVILCMLLLTSVAIGFAQTSGSCGDDLTWTLSEDEKTPTISGTGAMWNYERASVPPGSYIVPWFSHNFTITTVVIGNGVTSIAEGAF
jgi:hypothetical protein